MSAKKSEPSDFRKLLESISHRHDTRTVFDAFARFAACCLAAQTREAEYLEEAKRWEKAELELFGKALGALIVEMESCPFEDVLGGYYMEFALSSKGQQWNGEFHTPKTVCDMMARMVIDLESLPAEGPITVCEPACGAGAMILSIAQVCPPEARRRLRVTAIDINRTACDMAFINTSLWGVPTRVLHGDSLANKYWAAWSNIHYIAPWLPLAMLKFPRRRFIPNGHCFPPYECIFTSFIRSGGDVHRHSLAAVFVGLVARAAGRHRRSLLRRHVSENQSVPARRPVIHQLWQ